MRTLPHLSKIVSSERLLKFVIVGAVGAVFDILTTVFLANYIGINLLFSGVIGIEFSIVIMFYLNDRITFSESDSSPRYQRFLKSHLVRILGSVIQLFIFLLVYDIFFISVSKFGIDFWIVISKICGIVVSGVVNYVFESTFTWKIVSKN